MTKSLRIGIVGASAGGGWAKDSHVPALRNLSGLELVAVAASSQAKAEAAAKMFGAKTAYGIAQDLIRDPNVDLVAVCVKVPDHRLLVLSALAAGKHIYCEWPLGRDLTETEELAAAARAAGVHVAIGLQTRVNPVAIRARELIKSGKIGRVLSARVYSSTAAFGRVVPASMIYSEAPESGVSLVTIQGAHTVDLAIAVLGEITGASALTTIQYPEVEVGDKAVRQVRVIPDHLLMHARMDGGGALSVEVAGGRPPDATPFSFEVVGTEGGFTLEGGAMRGFQSGRLSLSVNGKAERVDEGETASLPDIAANVAKMYEVLRDDIAHGTANAPDFAHAVWLARLIEDLLSSGHGGGPR